MSEKMSEEERYETACLLRKNLIESIYKFNETHKIDEQQLIFSLESIYVMYIAKSSLTDEEVDRFFDNAKHMIKTYRNDTSNLDA
jgi:hypothetical protein